jgi:hypothetical protein
MKAAAAYKTITLTPAEQLDAIRANLAAFALENGQDLSVAIECLEAVGTKMRADGLLPVPAPKIYTWIEGRPGPPTLHNWQSNTGCGCNTI